MLKMLKKIKFPNKKLALLHCISDYPANDSEANLLSIKYLKDKLPVTIGYSDHVIGFESCLVAASFGAKIIEKHFTLDNYFSNFRDHLISLNPKDMRQMILSLRRVENMIGRYNKQISKSEKKNISSTRRSIYFNTNLKKGTILKNKHLKIVRPYVNFEPKDLLKILGKKINKDVQDSELVTSKILKNWKI